VTLFINFHLLFFLHILGSIDISQASSRYINAPMYMINYKGIGKYVQSINLHPLWKNKKSIIIF